MSSCVTDGSGLVCTIWNKTIIVVVSVIANAPELYEQHVSLCTRHCIGTLAISVLTSVHLYGHLLVGIHVAVSIDSLDSTIHLHPVVNQLSLYLNQNFLIELLRCKTLW